jgi:hypothetical protein
MRCIFKNLKNWKETYMRCNLYDLAKNELSAEFPSLKVERPTILLWWIMAPSLKNALWVGSVFAYVVKGPTIGPKHIEQAIVFPFDWGWPPEGKIIIFAHEGTSLVDNVVNHPNFKDVEIRYIKGCNCGGLSKAS